MERSDDMETTPATGGPPGGEQTAPGASASAREPPPHPSLSPGGGEGARRAGEGAIQGCPAPGESGSSLPKGTAIRYFGDYVLLGEIAQGGMGVVYRGRQVSLNRPVAVKMIRPDRASTAEALQRFRTEAEAAAGLDHPNIVPIYEVGQHEGQPYFSMRLVDGHDLAHEIGGKPMPPKRAAQILATVARAVHHAHQRGVLHRDLKPSNILLEQADSGNPVPIITDFGLAKLTERGRDLSASGAVLGTIEYMAPEQAAGKTRQLTTAADIYSLGAILFAILTGRPPFKREEEEGDLALLQRVNETEPPRPRCLKPACDPDLETICLKCLEKEPRRRYSSATEVAEELERCLRGEPILARPVNRWERVAKWYRRKPVVASLGTAVVVVFVVGFGTALWQWRQTARARKETQEALQFSLIQRAEELFSKDRAAEALAYLVDAVQSGRPNRVAAERLLSALSQRAWCLPPALSLRHDMFLWAACFSPDGERVVTASDDNTARIWNAHSGEAVTGPLQHKGQVLSARFSPDGLRVVTTSERSARVWNARSGEAVTEPLRHGATVWNASFSPDGQRVVTASSDKTARVWDAHTGQPLTGPLRHDYPVTTASFSPDGLRVLTTSGAAAYVWDAGAGRLATVPLRHGDLIESAFFSPDGQRVVTASVDRTARVWDARTGQALTEPLRHEHTVRMAAFSPDGLRVVTASRDKTARVWNARTGQPLTKPMQHEDTIVSPSFSPDGLRVLTASGDKTARVWDVHTGEPLSDSLRHEGTVLSASFSPDGVRVVTKSGAVARVWDARTTQPLTEPLQYEGTVASAEFTSLGLRVVTRSGATARVWDARTGQPLTQPLRHDGKVEGGWLSPDGLRLLTASRQRDWVWDVRTGQTLTDPLRWEEGLPSFSPDLLRVLKRSGDKTVRVWDVRTSQPLTEPLRHEGKIHKASFSPDGLRLVTASWDKTVRVWDACTGQPLTGPLRHDEPVDQTAFSPNGRLVVTTVVTENGYTARVWDVRTGQPLTRALQHEDRLASVAVSPDGLLVPTKSKDNTARVWDAKTGQFLAGPLRDEGEFGLAQFSPDGLRVLTAPGDKTVRVWDARTGQPLSEQLRHEGTVRSADFSPDGLRVVTTSEDNAARVWELPLPAASDLDALCRLAWVVGGFRLYNHRLLESVPLEERRQLREFFRSSRRAKISPLLQKLTTWLLFHDQPQTISPFSTELLSDYTRRRVQSASRDELRNLLAHSPTNVLVLSRLAQLLSGQDPKQASLARDDAEFLLRYSEKYATGEPLEAEFRGLSLVNLGQHEAALPLLAKAIASREKPGADEPKLKHLLQARAKAFQALGRTAEAAADTERAKGIAPSSK